MFSPKQHNDTQYKEQKYETYMNIITAPVANLALGRKIENYGSCKNAAVFYKCTNF